MLEAIWQIEFLVLDKNTWNHLISYKQVVNIK